MSIFKKSLFLIGLLLLTVVATGCTISVGSSGGSDGGVWKSTDSGVKWAQVVAVPAVGGKVASIAGVDVFRMVIDPQDENTIYLATEGDGIIYTNDAGASWRQIPEFKDKKIRSVAIDPYYKCSLYALVDNKLFKSNDCGRFWTNIYFHQNSSVILTDLEINPQDGSVIYMSTSAGEILKSTNGGESWLTVQRISKGSFIDIIINASDSKVVYAATVEDGIYKTSNAGVNWAFLGEGLKSYSGSHQYRSLIVVGDQIILVSKYGMLKSVDGAETWEIIDLLPAPKATNIYSAAINPKNNKEIYYTTATTLVKSVDGGISWSSQKLPFSRIASQVLINPDNPDIIYLGTARSNK